MSLVSFKRLGWLARRLSRMYPAEVPYRVASVLRATAQQHGFLDASRVPAREIGARFGAPWVGTPDNDLADPAAVFQVARSLLDDGVQVFDVCVPIGSSIADWNADPKTGISIPTTFGLAIDFRHIANGVDIKHLWELNRHTWWVPLAQAYAISGDRVWLDAIECSLDDWLMQCPYPLGANWSSPVEHGIRLINWSIVWHLTGGENSPLFSGPAGPARLEKWLASIYQHIRFARDNYSFYSSSDNHLIGEAAGIYVAANTWGVWPEVRKVGQRAKALLEREMMRQFSSDGVNLEQAFCYHKFSLEFMVAALLSGEANGEHFSESFHQRLLASIRFMAAMTDCEGRTPAIGDSDDGLVFRLVGDGTSSAYVAMQMFGASYYGVADLQDKLQKLGHARADAIWLKISSGKRSVVPGTSSQLPERFVEGGYLLFGRDLHDSNELRIVMDVGSLGYNRISGHGHADALALLLSYQGKDFLIDPGTYCYNAAPELRHYFRGTSAHNTAVVDEVDQSVYGGSFLWLRDVHCRIHRLDENSDGVLVEASHDGYMRLHDPVTHIRTVRFNRHQLTLDIEDRFDCKESHSCSLHWHIAAECSVDSIENGWSVSRDGIEMQFQIEFERGRSELVSGRVAPPLGWVSRRFYEKQPNPVICVQGNFDSTTVVKTRITLVS